jgi:bifunctional non-homologous end joining protein LigD
VFKGVLPAGFVAPCLPTKAAEPPSGGLWLHEIKHDGFRVIARKDDTYVRLYSRPGNDLTWRFPLIVQALASLRSRSCVQRTAIHGLRLEWQSRQSGKSGEWQI